MPIPDFISFLILCLIVELTPGPNMTYLALLSASEGRKAGFAAIFGIALGLLVIGMAAALGIAAVITDFPFVYQILRWGGVIYLLWLAWDSWQEGKETSPARTDNLQAHLKFFNRGLITNLLNPKAAVFYIAMLPGFIDISSRILEQTIMLTVSYVLVATFIHITIVIFAGFAYQWLRDKKRNLFVRRGFALALIIVALWFALSTRF